MAKYRVVSIDGGGIRGLVTIALLQRIIATPGIEDFLESIDLVAGTSTGGLLALGIAHRIPLTEMRDLYVKKGTDIFEDSWLDDLADLGKLSGAEYDIKPLRREMQRLFKKTTLGQLKKRVWIPDFDRLKCSILYFITSHLRHFELFLLTHGNWLKEAI